jgi:hypothetical protein
LTAGALTERIARDHPHHSLYQIFALGNGEVVFCRSTSARVALSSLLSQVGDSKTLGRMVIDPDKIRAAKNMIEKLRTHSPERIRQMEFLINAYREKYVQLLYSAFRGVESA